MAPSVRIEAEDLDRLVGRLWTDGDDSSPVLVSRSPLPATHRLAECYAIVPSARRPRYLIPLSPPRLAARATYAAPHSSRSAQLLRMAAAIGATTLSRDRLYVGIRNPVPVTEWTSHLLLSRIAADLDEAQVAAVLPVRRVTPTTKPTLRLFDGNGASIGFAKVGWSTPTRRLVANEAAVLGEFEGVVGHVRTPRLRAAGELDGRTYLVTDAGPSPIRRLRSPESRLPGLVREIAATGEVLTCSLAASPFLNRLRADLARSRDADRDLVGLVEDWLAELARSRDDAIGFGRWHGDWTSWNVVSAGGVPYAWDWEFSQPSVPVGLDLLHWSFQHRLAAPGGTLATALDAAIDDRHALHGLGIPARQHELLVALYAITVLTRACVLRSEGSGWNPRIHPGARDVVASLVARRYACSAPDR